MSAPTIRWCSGHGWQALGGYLPSNHATRIVIARACDSCEVTER